MKEKSDHRKVQTPLFNEIEKELETYKEILGKEIEEQKTLLKIKREEAFERVDQMAQNTLDEVRAEWDEYEKRLELFRHDKNAKLEHWFARIRTDLESSSLVPSLVSESIVSLCQISEQQERSN